MNWHRTGNNKTIDLKLIPLVQISELREDIINQCKNGLRPIAFFGKKQTANEVMLYVILADDNKSQLLVSTACFKPGEHEYNAITPDIPAFSNFEREFYESHGITPVGHPWLKPLRSPSGSNTKMQDYKFWNLNGESIHEVAVGPVHAGVIEPGHFRFMCAGEEVKHLEIQLGYQHRGVEKLLTQGNILDKAVLIEKIAGESSVANSSAYANILETCSETRISTRIHAVRTIAMEIERIALHISTLGGLSADIAYLPGNTFLGATRTYVINSLMALCGSRFGFGLIRPGKIIFDIDNELAATLKKTLTMVHDRLLVICETMFDSPDVLSRFEKTGTVSKQNAAAIGMVGVTARASGIKIDVRADHPYAYFKLNPVVKIALKNGDVFDRGFMRYLEARRSLQYVLKLLDNLPAAGHNSAENLKLRPETLSVSMVEGPRGEIVHCMISDSNCKCIKYKIKKPSFNNWYGLAMAVRTEGISDFPICNKSFDLSYCGHDL